MVLDARLSTLYPEHKILSTLVSQSCKTILPRVPCVFAETAYPSQPTSPEYMVDTSLTQSCWDPLEDVPPPLGHSLLMLHLPLHSGPHCQVGDRSLMAFIITVPYRLIVRDAGFPRAMGFFLRHQYTLLQFVQASLHIALRCGITESTIHICLQGIRGDPPLGASGGPCRLVQQTGAHRLLGLFSAVQ